MQDNIFGVKWFIYIDQIPNTHSQQYTMLFVLKLDNKIFSYTNQKIGII